MLRSTLAEFLNLFPTVLKVFRHKVDKPTDLIDQMVELATIARKDGMIALENQEISNRMLAKGVTALVDGNDANLFEHLWRETRQYIATSRVCSKHFSIMG